MGKTENMGYGSFSGRVGPLVGGTWRGIPYIRFYPETIRDAKTPKQVAQRGKFALAVDFVKHVLPYVRVGYRDDEVKASAYNRALSYISKYGIEGEAGEFVLNYENIYVSHGLLTAIEEAQVCIEGNMAHFTWVDNSGVGSARPSDVAMPMVWNVTKGVGTWDTDGTTRKSGAMDLKVVESWVNDDCVAYLGFRSTSGDAVANSLHMPL